MSARVATGFVGRIAPAERADQLADLDRLADLLDSRWRIPGTNWRFGVDAVASVVPVVGDLSTAVVSAYMVKRAHELGAPKSLLAKMVANVAFDAIVGSVPVVGTVFDFAFKANRRNMALLHKHFDGR